MVANFSAYEPYCGVHYSILIGGGFTCKDRRKSIGVINAAISPFTAMANFLTLIAIYRHKVHRHKPIMSLINLSVCSLLTGLIAQPLYSSIYLGSSMTLHQCEVILSFEIAVETFMSCAFLTLCFVGFERFISIFYPFKEASLLTERNTFIVVLAIWCFSLLSSMTVLFSTKAKEIMYHMDFALTIVGTLWMAFVYVRVLLLVRKIRRRVEDRERRFSSTSREAHLTRTGKGTWITALAISFMTVFHAIYDMIIMVDKISNRQGIRLTELEICEHMFAWALLLYLSLSLVIPITLWISNGQIRQAMNNMYASFLCFAEEQAALFGMRESRSSKPVLAYLNGRRQHKFSETSHQRDCPAVLYHEY